MHPTSCDSPRGVRNDSQRSHRASGPSIASMKHSTQHFMDTCIKGVDTSNAPPIPHTNRFLALFHKRGRSFLVFALAIVLAVLSCIVSSMLILLRCSQELPFERLFLLTLRQLIGFNTDYLSSYGGPEDAPLECLGIVTSGDFMALLVQVVLVSILASCFLKTRVPLVMSERLLATKRDGNLILAFRIAHPQGHLTLNGEIKFVWVKPHSTVEGERHSKVIDLKTSTMYPMLSIPLTVTHVVDTSSPLFPYLDDLRDAPGHLHAVFTGGDFVLGCQTLGTAMYHFKDVLLQHRFAPLEDYENTKRQKVDFRRFHLAEPQCVDDTVATQQGFELPPCSYNGQSSDAKQGLPLLQDSAERRICSTMPRQMLSNGDDLDWLDDMATTFQQKLLATLCDLQASIREVLEKVSVPLQVDLKNTPEKRLSLAASAGVEKTSDEILHIEADAKTNWRERGVSDNGNESESLRNPLPAGDCAKHLLVQNGSLQLSSESHHVPHLGVYR